MALRTRPYFGIGINGELTDADRLRERARLADELGYDLISIMDHPYAANRPEAYAALAVMLGHTQRITGYVGVTNLPLRPAPVLARTLSTLTAFTTGRIVLGLGSGGFWDQITKLGVPPRRPLQAVRAFEEAIELVHALSGGGDDPVNFDGTYYQVHDVYPAPVPAPPIWTGSSGRTALAITGRLADGWIPARGADWTSEHYQWARPLIDQAASAAGRDPAAVLTYFNVSATLTSAPLARSRSEDGRWLGGSAEQWSDELTRAVLDHGGAGFNLALSSDDDTEEDTLRRFAAEVIPAVRAAVHPVPRSDAPR